MSAPLDALRYHVTGAIERGEAVAIEAVEHGTPYAPFRTELSPEDVAKVPAGKYGMIDVHTAARALNAPSGHRPRM